MKKVVKFLKTKGARLFAILFVSLLAVVLITPTITAGGPVFNDLPGDHELLRGANSSTDSGTLNWTDPVSGKDGETISVLAYYHNTVPDTFARNTHISVALTSNHAQKHVLSGKLWANNADVVNDTLVINSSQNVKVEYIPGSTRWYPDRQLNPDADPIVLPDGITTPQGVSLGDIQGCWEYAGYVIFQLKLKKKTTPPPCDPCNPEIAIDKEVANSTRDSGTHNWSNKTQALKGEVVAFKLKYSNMGKAPAENVVIRDLLPAKLNYIPGSTMLYNNDTGTNGKQLADGIVTNGVTIGKVMHGTGGIGYVVFKAKVKHNLANQRHVLTNIAKIRANGGLKDQDDATVVVPRHFIEREKRAHNITQDKDAIKIKAQQGDVIIYHLVSRNTGNHPRNNFEVRDNIADILDNAKLISISNNGQLEGNTLVWPKLDLQGQQEIDYTFKVKVKKQADNSDCKMINVYGNEVAINIYCPVAPTLIPELKINKYVRLADSDEKFVKENTANPGDILEYKLIIKNPGTGAATNLNLFDVLPVSASYVKGSFTVIKPLGIDSYPGWMFSQNGAQLGEIGSFDKTGETIVIVFRAKVASGVADEAKLCNKGVVTADEGLNSNSKACTIIEVEEEEEPEEPVEPKIKGITKLPSTGTNVWTIIVTSLAVLIIAGAGYTIYRYSNNK